MLAPYALRYSGRVTKPPRSARKPAPTPAEWDAAQARLDAYNEAQAAAEQLRDEAYKAVKDLADRTSQRKIAERLDLTKSHVQWIVQTTQARRDDTRDAGK